MAAFGFASGALPAGAVIERAAGPWSRTDRFGVMEFGTAANTPRFDYDPIMGVSRGLLVEPERTNYCVRSRNLTAQPPWNLRGLTLVPGQGSIDGANLASRINETGEICAVLTITLSVSAARSALR